MNSSAYGMTTIDWEQYFEKKGFPPTSVDFFTHGLYKDPAFLNRHISSQLITQIHSTFEFNLPKIAHCFESSDGTVKFQIQFSDGMSVETVLIPFYKKYTICLSTQVGCGMNCSFCFTGTQGLKRNLEAGEIVGQYLKVYKWLKMKNNKSSLPSIVFMGQGEPLHNFEQVKKAITVLNDPKLIGVGHRQMTLSTVGYLPHIKNLTELPKINIAFSIHSPFHEQRSELIPINRTWPLHEVLDNLKTLPLLKRQFITFEYLLIKNYNMTPEHAEELGKILLKERSLINLIPFNPFPGSKWERPDEDEIESFKNLLVKQKLRVMVRKTKGDKILAACGQLKINHLGKKHG